jgi:hypothetical protein
MSEVTDIKSAIILIVQFILTDFSIIWYMVVKRIELYARNQKQC